MLIFVFCFDKGKHRDKYESLTKFAETVITITESGLLRNRLSSLRNLKILIC